MMDKNIELAINEKLENVVKVFSDEDKEFNQRMIRMRSYNSNVADENEEYDFTSKILADY